MSLRRFNRHTGSSVSKEFEYGWFGNNRHVCDVLSDMRKCLESLNFSPMKGLIEEAQVMANRMEAALQDQKSLIDINEKYAEMRRDYKALKRKHKKKSKA